MQLTRGFSGSHSHRNCSSWPCAAVLGIYPKLVSSPWNQSNDLPREHSSVTICSTVRAYTCSNAPVWHLIPHSSTSVGSAHLFIEDYNLKLARWCQVLASWVLGFDDRGHSSEVFVIGWLEVYGTWKNTTGRKSRIDNCSRYNRSGTLY